ncbi:MAG: hypothetical protein WDA07_06525 [Leucobacter sp.]
MMGEEAPLFMLGTAYAISADAPEEAPEEQVRKVAEEVTGKSLQPPKRTIGFLWGEQP